MGTQERNTNSLIHEIPEYISLFEFVDEIVETRRILRRENATYNVINGQGKDDLDIVINIVTNIFADADRGLRYAAVYTMARRADRTATRFGDTFQAILQRMGRNTRHVHSDPRIQPRVSSIYNAGGIDGRPLQEGRPYGTERAFDMVGQGEDQNDDQLVPREIRGTSTTANDRQPPRF